MKRIIAVLLVLAMVFALAACGTPANNNNAAPGNNNNAQPVAEKKVLRVSTKADITSLCNLLATVNSADTPGQQLMQDRLFEYDQKTGQYAPMLCKEAKMIDSTHYELTLRDDVYSWNGDKLVASDVLYSFKVAQDAGVNGRYYGNFDIENFKVVDDTHIIIALKSVDTFILTTLANIPYGIVVEKSVQGKLEDSQFDLSKVTYYTGPYKPVKWETGVSITFEKNEKYWGGTPAFDEIVLIATKDPTGRASALESKTVDLVLEPPTTMIETIESEGFQVIAVPTTNSHTLFTNTNKAPFDDVNARRALALALNREAIVKIALNGRGQVSDSILPIGNPRYEKQAETYFRYDLAAAKELWAKSKYAGQEVTVELVYGSEHEQVATQIQQMWKELGVTVKLRGSTTLRDEIRVDDPAKQIDCWIINNANPSPADHLKFYDGQHFTASQLSGGPNWDGGENKERIGQLFEAIRSEVDEAKLKEYYSELQKLITLDAPSIPLYVPDKLAFAVKNLDGIILTEYGDINFSKSFFK